MASKLLERFLLVLVVLVATTQAAADGHKSAGGARRRATAEPPVPITILTSAVEKGAGTYLVVTSFKSSVFLSCLHGQSKSTHK